ncbi:hypothetical protein SUDANB176_00287 [Streptomyces sp. enrichment culture]|uniref:hypothetical protein n=1 Tax=Streptomyces sp. enrichment culture TaxID=1795815 RepID=UPI003F559F5C
MFRPGVPRKSTDADLERVIVKTPEEKPKNATRWSTRPMAPATGMSRRPSRGSGGRSDVRPGPAPFLDREVPAGPDVHLVPDNCVIRKTPAVKKRLLAHPRFHLRSTPASSSWPNLVERWFAELTQKKLERGVHRSVRALEHDIRSWLADWNEHPGPFVRTKTADGILDKVAACCRRVSGSDHWEQRLSAECGGSRRSTGS